MTDDQQTAEPRSAVEAAASPAHGGGQAADSAVNRDRDAAQRVMDSAQFRWAASPDLSGFEATGQYVGGDHAPRSIMAGVTRLMRIADGSRMLVNDLDKVVGSLTGRTEGPVETKGEGHSMGSAETMHDALDAIEEAFARLVAMTQRAKAAHG